MSAFWKDLFREIRNTPGRFLSLLIITALGASSVVGIQAASIDMRAVADKTYKEHSLYDLQIKSTMGFDEEDITALGYAEGGAAVMPTVTFDVFTSIESENRAVRTYALPAAINTIDVLEGRLPLGPGECAVEAALLVEGAMSVGDTLRLSLDDMADYHDVLAGDTFTVVGVVSSPLYITFERGNTTLGDGALQYYLYLHPEAYILDVYTDVYLLMDGSRGMDNLTDDYYAAADEWKPHVEQIGAAQVKAKKDELDDAQREIDDGWVEYLDGMNELSEKIADGRQELEDAKVKLADAKAELEDGQRTLDANVAEGQDEIEKQAAELRSGQKELNARLAELEAGEAQILDAREQLEQSIAGLSMMGPRGVSPELDVHYEQAYGALKQLDDRQAEIDEGRAALAAAQRKLSDGVRRISEARLTLDEERGQAQDEIDEGWAEYFDGLDELSDGVTTLETEEADGLMKLSDAKRELEDAQEKLDDAPEPEWFYFTRKDGLSFDSYYQDTLRLQKIGYVFPLLFFLVAVMVSLTSMSRMVEEHRTQIGIYMALGYRPAAIMAKYLIYAFGASIIGGVSGVILGSRLFPSIIADAYGHLYDMPPIEMPIPAFIAMLSVVSAVLSVVLVTLWTCTRSMAGTPALLMRPRPPARGKRVWLERISLIWNRLGFFSKVTARNIFRYKKRFIMTLVGVAGCSALLLTAFGLRDSIGNVADLQYGSIVEYDARAYLKDITTDGQRAKLEAALPGAHLFIREETVTAKGADGGLSASLIVPDAPESLNRFFNLYSPQTGEAVGLPSSGVLITEKLARVMGVEVGGGITMTYSDGRAYAVTVAGIVDNYVFHFIYISPAYYKELFSEDPYPNSALVFYENGRDFAAPLLGNGDVRAVVHNDDLISQIGDSADAMGIVTIVLIVLACALALVVLFNLTNINISERIRELATIKVLGFNDTELAMYIYRENGLVTLLGVILGLVGGIFLHGYVIGTVEIDLLKFPRIIYPQSYAFAVVLSLVFAVFVNVAMNYKLARIDMVESLKNVE